MPTSDPPVVGSPAEAESGAQPKPRILIADDDPEFRQSLASLLMCAGYETLVASDAENATELLRISHFDLIVADIHMPGNEALQWVRSLPVAAPGVPLILLTGQPSVETAMEAVHLPVTAYLRKPPNADELLRIVRQSIANWRIYETVTATRRDLQSWTLQLENLEASLRQTPGASQQGPVNASLGIALQNVLSGLFNLKQLVEALAQQEGTDDSFRCAAQTTAIQETIEVLEKTKRSFKSTELGALRRKLEALIGFDQRKDPS